MRIPASGLPCEGQQEAVRLQHAGQGHLSSRSPTSHCEVMDGGVEQKSREPLLYAVS